MKPSIPLLLIVLACGAPASAPARAQVAAPAAQGQIVGIEGTQLRWRMTPDQARAATPAAWVFERAGTDGTRVYYQLDGLVAAGFGEEFIEWLAFLRFENNQLTGFDLRPRRERVTTGAIGDAEAWSDYLSLASYRARAFPEVEAPKLRAVSEIQIANGDAARLGFQIQYYAWSARGAFYRQSIMQGSYRNNVGIARLQGRLEAPFTPLQLAGNGTNRADFARALSFDFGLPPSLERALMADPTLLRAPKPAHQGNQTGVDLFNWGMTGAEILASPLPTGARIEAAKDGYVVRDYKLDRDSTLLWKLQLTLDKKGLSEFELRPQNELQTDARLGLFSDAQAADYQDALDAWLEERRGLEPGQWWQESREVNARVKRHYRAQSGTGINITGYGFGYAASTYPIYSTYKQFISWPVGLDFTIRDRAWTARGNHYRQAQLRDAQRGPKINVIRFQGRRDDKPFVTGTGKLVKTKNPKIVMREVYENYHVW